MILASKLISFVPSSPRAVLHVLKVIPLLSSAQRSCNRTSAAVTDGTGDASDRNALLPRCRRYCCPSCHSKLSARGTKSCTTSRPAWAWASTCAAGDAYRPASCDGLLGLGGILTSLPHSSSPVPNRATDHRRASEVNAIR